MVCKVTESCVLVKTDLARNSHRSSLPTRAMPVQRVPLVLKQTVRVSLNRCRQAVFAITTSLGASACDATKPLPPAVFVAPAALTLEDGQTAKLTATLRNPKSRAVRWSTSNASVAIVDLVGGVTAVSNGTAVITVKMVDDTTIINTVPITVVGPAIATVNVTPANATLYVNGLAVRLSVVLRASDGRVIRSRALTYGSPDANVADVTTTGIVRGRSPGGPIPITVTAEGQVGTSRIRVAHAAEICPVVTPLAFDQRATGTLALGDCEFSLDNSYVDVYDITLTTATTIQIDMTSGDVDSYIGLFESNGLFIGEDDNSGGDRNARLVKQLNAGRYRIWANTITGGATGSYSIVVTQRAPSAAFSDTPTRSVRKFH